MSLDGEVTFDTLLRGRVKLIQPVRGFRASLDPIFLAAFVGEPFGRFLDIGGGTGALSFLLLARDPAAMGVAIEIQPHLAELAKRACVENGFDSRFEILCADARRARLAAGSFDLIVTNPPFRALGTGVLPPDESKALANYEVALSMSDWLAVAAKCLRPEGRLAVVFPAERLAELQAEMLARGLSPVRLRSVHPRIDTPANRVLVEARKGPVRPLTIEPPLIVHEAETFSREVQVMLGEGTL